MPSSTAEKKPDIITTVKEGFSIGIGSMVPIFVNVLLWVLTIWIPYLNVGTTIGLWVGIVSKASRGEAIPMTEIFDSNYRKYMGEYFLTSGLVGIGVGIAWSLAILLVIDKGMNLANSNLVYVGCQSFNGKDKSKLSRISNGRVSLPMWTLDKSSKVKKYSGSDAKSWEDGMATGNPTMDVIFDTIKGTLGNMGKDSSRYFFN
jgi:hypothetical protein